MTTIAYKPMSVIKKELRRIVRDIDKKLYSKLIDLLAIPWQVYEEFDTAESYFVEQLMNDELCPWTVAECLIILGHPIIADNLEMFASTFDFSTKAIRIEAIKDKDMAIEATDMNMEMEDNIQHLKGIISPTQDTGEMKKELGKIIKQIESDLYAELLLAMRAPQNTINECKTAKVFFIEQLLNKTLLNELKYPDLAKQFEEFAVKFNFVKEVTSNIPETPEIATMKLLKCLKSELSEEELLAIRFSQSKTFESIFSDMLDLEKLTPSLEELIQIFKDEERQDLATTVSKYSHSISTMEPVLFSRIVRLCLDTLDVNIFSLLSNLKVSLSKEYATYRMHSRKFSYSTEFIPLTFTKEVDTRTLPLTEGSDAELLTLMENASKQEKKETQYIDAHTEIYSTALNGKLISLIGHPGTGKSFYCNKLVSDYATLTNSSFRFVFLIACRDSRWHALEEKSVSEPVKSSQTFLQMIISDFPNCDELVQIIIRTEGNGLLLIIDSYDEFPQTFNFKSTLLFKILKRQVLPKCTILITSRPGAWNILLRGYGSDLSFDLSWQILGFSPDQRNKFITTTLSQDKAATCSTFLQSHPELNILTLVPVNISLLTELIANSYTLTDMYKHLVLFTLDNEFKRFDKQSPAITSLNSLPGDMLAQFNTLTELAYQGLTKRQITFSPEEFPDITTLTKKYTKGLGLFNVITVNTAQLTTIDYLSCPHLTLQEFLAAWHLAQKSTTYITVIVKQTFSDDTWPFMKMCIRFMCGLLTQGHNSILSIITDNLHHTSAPLFNCKYSLFRDSVYNYPELHKDNTATHLSVLPYVLETNQPSILSSYYKLLCPANSSIPHFYLEYITPVDTYSLTQFFIKLPSNSAISVLSLDIRLHNSIQLEMLANSINTIIIDTLRVIFRRITDTTLQEYYKKQLPIYIEHIKYEIQQLHINTHDMPTLLEELNDITSSTYKYNMYKLQLILSTLKLAISNFTRNADIIHYKKLFSFIRNISKDSCLHTPNQIFYLFIGANFVDATIFKSLMDSISSNATYVMLSGCYFSTQFITTLVTSLHKLEYLHIRDYWLNFDEYKLKKLHILLNPPTINALTFQMLQERNIKGLYLEDVTLQDSILYEYLHSQSSLQEIYLHDTTDSTPATLHAILHLSSLQYIHIRANDMALYEQHANTEESMSALLTILHNNRHTLSYADFTLYEYFLTAHYADIMLTLSQCSNLQCINFSICSLFPRHMQELATTIQLHALLYIDMSYNDGITDKAIITLTDALATHYTVMWINLSNCNISSAPVIISLMTKFPCLQMIKLRANKFNETSKQESKMFAKQRKINIDI